MPAKAINLLNFSKTTSSSLMEKIKFSNKVPIYITIVNSNIQMKQSELAKMTDLEGKMKVIFEKMNDEKKVYVTENQKMTKELMEIKDLIMGLLNQAEEAPNA
jgi:hypothetical protein